MTRHPLREAREEFDHLADLALRGESAATPAVLIGAVALVVVTFAAALIAVGFGAGYLATRGSGHVGPATSSVPLQAGRPGDRPIGGGRSGAAHLPALERS